MFRAAARTARYPAVGHLQASEIEIFGRSDVGGVDIQLPFAERVGRPRVEQEVGLVTSRFAAAVGVAAHAVVQRSRRGEGEMPERRGVDARRQLVAHVVEFVLRYHGVGMRVLIDVTVGDLRAAHPPVGRVCRRELHACGVHLGDLRRFPVAAVGELHPVDYVAAVAVIGIELGAPAVAGEVGPRVPRHGVFGLEVAIALVSRGRVVEVVERRQTHRLHRSDVETPVTSRGIARADAPESVGAVIGVADAQGSREGEPSPLFGVAERGVERGAALLVVVVYAADAFRLARVAQYGAVNVVVDHVRSDRSLAADPVVRQSDLGARVIGDVVVERYLRFVALYQFVTVGVAAVARIGRHHEPAALPEPSERCQGGGGLFVLVGVGARIEAVGSESAVLVSRLSVEESPTRIVRHARASVVVREIGVVRVAVAVAGRACDHEGHAVGGVSARERSVHVAVRAARQLGADVAGMQRRGAYIHGARVCAHARNAVDDVYGRYGVDVDG